MVAENPESVEAVQEVQPEPNATTDDGSSTSFLYFSYGSNMLAERIRVQVTAAVFMTTAVLADFELCFFDRSELWQGAVASIERKPDTRVWGCVWRVPNSLAAELDEQEYNYRRLDVDVTIHTDSGPSIPSSPMRCRTYQYSNPDRKLNRPSPHYRQVIITGALEHGLPSAYVDWIVNSFPTNDYQGQVKLKLKAIEHLNSLEHREQRQQNEVTAAVFMTTAVLADFELCFFDRSELWQGAVASIERKPYPRVWGCVWRVPNSLAAELDEQEYNYRRLDAIVQIKHMAGNIQQQEAVYENVLIENKRPLLPRRHENILPFTMGTFTEFAQRDNDVDHLYVLALLDQSRFPAMSIFQLNERFCQNENQAAVEMVAYYEPMISYIASYVPGSPFVVLKLTYSRDVPMNLLCNSLQKFLNHMKNSMDVGFVQQINHPNLLD